MITVPGLASEALGSYLSTHLGRRFHSTEAHLTELIPSIARLSLECIGNSDALYHNVEHTMLVTLVGYDIMKGRALLTHTTPGDYSHLLVACLLHDIGYVRGILKGDGIDGYVIDGRGNKITVPRGSSDAALLQYHVDRSKLFVMDRLSDHDHLDAERIARAIEFTRFPPSKDSGRNGSSAFRACQTNANANATDDPSIAMMVGDSQAYCACLAFSRRADANLIFRKNGRETGM